jgi:hypothetical protein
MNKMRAAIKPGLAIAGARALMAAAGPGLCFGLLAAVCFPYQVTAAEVAIQPPELIRPDAVVEMSAPVTPAATFVAATPVVIGAVPKSANFANEHASQEARDVAEWIVDSGNNGSLPFAIVDKTDAKVFVFDARGRLSGAAPALLGLARGDDAVPGIGNRPLSSIRPEDRTTPAGRFVASLSRNIHGNEILWVDYETAISMHPVINTKPAERRPQRLATATPLDNRISFGCINVPAKFFENVVRPAFTGTNGIVYVLPETRPARAVFSSYDVREHARLQSAIQAVPARVAAATAAH